VEVKHGPRGITCSLASFIRKYRPPVALVATPQPFVREVESTPVYGVPPYYF